MKTFVITIGCASLVSLPAGTASKDQTFVDEASRGGKMEVELGQLAQRNASSSAVREFGARMVKDHTRLNNELGSVATSIGLTVPTNPKISAFPMRRGELPVGSGKFLKNGLILVGSGRVW
jgi:predicted outer membrane protein